jgi:catechol 2,3-dioxygenase-like lactoylglutathione lyase family enzyme
LKKAAKFYKEVLGLEKKYEFSSYVGFECGEVEIGLIPKLREGEQAKFTDPDGNILEIVQIDWEKYFSVSAEGDKKKREPT